MVSKLLATKPSQKGVNGDTLTFKKPTLISVGTVYPWKVRMMVAVVILFPSFVIIIFCASLTPCSSELCLPRE